MPQTASRPVTLEEAASFLAGASEAGSAVTIGEDLDPSGLDRILEHEAGDLTCTVEAGVRLSALRDAVAPAGYPALHYLTSPIRKASAARGDPEQVNVWAGTGYREITERPAADILAELAATT